MLDWYTNLRDKSAGPYSLDEIRFMTYRGLLSPEDSIRCGEKGPWAPAHSFDELFPDFCIEPPDSALKRESPPAEPVDQNASESAEEVRPPSLPKQDTDNERRKQILIGTGIGAAIALLILLLLLFIQRYKNDDFYGQGQLAQSGGAGGSENLVGGSGRAGDGDQLIDGHDVAEPDDGDASEGVVDEGEFSSDELADGGGGAADLEPPPENMEFSVRRIDDAQPVRPANEGGGNLAEFSDRLAREGAQSGEVQVSLIWNNTNDLDLHLVCPSGERIFYRNKRSRCGGELDVDMNAGDGQPLSNEPVENVFWPEDGAPTGEFEVWVDHFRNHGARDPTKFEVIIKQQGKVRKFSGALRHGQQKKIHEFKRV